MKLAVAILLLSVLLLSGCANVRPATGRGRATTTVQEFRRHDVETRWIVTVDNPTGDAVFIDCDELRIRIAAHTQSDVLLTPDDVRCDLKNDVEYGGLPPRLGRHWGHFPRPRVSP